MVYYHMENEKSEILLVPEKKTSRPSTIVWIIIAFSRFPHDLHQAFDQRSVKKENESNRQHTITATLARKSQRKAQSSVSYSPPLKKWSTDLICKLGLGIGHVDVSSQLSINWEETTTESWDGMFPAVGCRNWLSGSSFSQMYSALAFQGSPSLQAKQMLPHNGL